MNGPSLAEIDSLFGHDCIEGNVVGLHGHSIKQLALESQSDGECIGTRLTEQSVEVSATVPYASARSIEGDTGNGEQIEFPGLDASISLQAEVLQWFEDAESVDRQFRRVPEQKEIQIVSDAVGYDRPFLACEKVRDKLACGDLIAKTHVDEHRNRIGEGRKSTESPADRETSVVSIGKSATHLKGTSPDFRLGNLGPVG